MLRLLHTSIFRIALVYLLLMGVTLAVLLGVIYWSTAGLIERRGGSTSLDQLGGLARLAPLLGGLFFLPALNLAGIPPFSGFLGKVGLLQAGAEHGTWASYTLIAGSVLTSLLTLYAVSRVWNRAFWSAPPVPVASLPGRLRAGMVLPTSALVLVGLAITVVAGPLFRFTDSAAQEMLARAPYVDAVFPQGAP